MGRGEPDRHLDDPGVGKENREAEVAVREAEVGGSAEKPDTQVFDTIKTSKVKKQVKYLLKLMTWVIIQS